METGEDPKIYRLPLNTRLLDVTLSDLQTARNSPCRATVNFAAFVTLTLFVSTFFHCPASFLRWRIIFTLGLEDSSAGRAIITEAVTAQLFAPRRLVIFSLRPFLGTGVCVGTVVGTTVASAVTSTGGTVKVGSIVPSTVAVAVKVGLGVGVLVWVPEGVFVGGIVGVSVGLGVAVLVAVAVKVAVAVGVLVAVRVGVAVAVRVGVGVAVGSPARQVVPFEI
jgi:hypothetical protein